MCAARLFLAVFFVAGFCCADPVALDSLAGCLEAVKSDEIALEAAKTEMRQAIVRVDPVATAIAIKKLERTGMRIPVLPYVELLSGFVSGKHVAGQIIGGLSGVAALACASVVALKLVCPGLAGMKHEDGVLWHLCRHTEETDAVESGVVPPTVSRTGVESEPVYWLDKRCNVCAWGLAGLVCLGVWRRFASDNFNDNRAREIVDLLFSSRAFTIGEDDQKVAASLRRLGIVLIRERQSGTGVKN